jgi:ATP-binding cassette, subfamily F, member 3
MLQLTNVTKTYGERTVLDDVTFTLSPTSRVGLVGRNGAGKSTLFHIMMGELTPEGGNVSRMPNTSIQRLTQEPQLTPGNTLIEEAMSAFPSIKRLEDDEARLLAKWDSFSEAQMMDASEELVNIGMMKETAQQAEAEVSRLLQGLGFSLVEFQQPVERFSGGWQMRINLAKVLLQKPDFLLLDEPTNHLDVEAREWLEDFLMTYTGGILLITHDRHFLDKVATEIAELELGKLTVWSGNYTKAMERKAEAIEKLQAAAERQARELEKQQAFVDRFRASATKSTQAKSREKQLAKIERIEPPKTDMRRMRVEFPAPPLSGREVLSLRGINKAYGQNILYANLQADMERGQRIFILGANGTGKTTLLKLILKEEAQDAGTITLGRDVGVGYFSQHQLETLNPKHSVLESLRDVAPVSMGDTDLRGLLGRFLFKGEEAFKKVGVCSGGEKSRLALARLVLGGSNLLLLDEPTNHMDLPAQEAMAEAFASFEGSLLCISHDRAFIQSVATDIWELYRNEVIVYEGDYAHYLDKRAERRAAVDERQAKALAKAASSRPTPKVQEKPAVQANQAFTEKKLDLKRIGKLEKSIAKEEAELERIAQAIASKSDDFEALQVYSKEAQETQARLDALSEEWMSLH